jgi:hypothetical protein
MNVSSLSSVAFFFFRASFHIPPSASVLQSGEFNSTLANRLIHVYFSYIFCFLPISVFPSSFPFHFAISPFGLSLFSSLAQFSHSFINLFTFASLHSFWKQTPLNHSFLASSLV